jgi:hypothetical protein
VNSARVVLVGAAAGLTACWPGPLEPLDAAPCNPTMQSCSADLSTPSSPCPATPSFSAAVQPIFDAKCVGCHDGSRAPLDLQIGNSYPMLMQAPNGQKCGPGGAGTSFSAAWRRVAPGDLANSVLWWYLQDCCTPACGAACGPLCLPQCSTAVTKCGSSDPLCGGARTTDADHSIVECWILGGAPNN